MPRFSDTEKENIQQRLLVEGERLFAAYGIKKVTIDDLVEAVNIAKATFYRFYESKEYLYMDIVQGIQKKIINELDTLLDHNNDLSPKERVRLVFAAMTQLMTQYPILSQIDSSTVDLISRKVSQERLAAYLQQNFDAAQSLSNHGVTFSCDIKTASYTFQTLYHSWIYLQDNGADDPEAVITILLNGVIDQIVE